MAGLYVQLDANWVDHPKVMEVGLDGAGLHAMALCMAKRIETDGILHRTHLRRLGASDELVGRLIDAGLFDVIDDRRVRIHGWLSRNPSQGAIAASRTAKAASGREGNHKRWGHAGPVETCLTCTPPEPPTGRLNGEHPPSSSQGAIPPDSHPESHSDVRESPERESETKRETKTKGVSRVVVTPEAERLSHLLADSIGQRGSKRPNVTDGWVTDMDKLIRIDGREADDVARVIRWLNDGRDEVAQFWQANVRSPRKLREKWDQMREQYERRKRGTSREQNTDQAWSDSQALLRAVPDGANPIDMMLRGAG